MEIAEDSINLSKRQSPRVACKLPVAYEIVEWDDFRLDDLQLPQWTTCHDVSALGLGFSSRLLIPPLTRHDLDRGIKKLRVSINLPVASPIVTFARLVWGCDGQTSRSGLHFLDMPAAQFQRLGGFVGHLLGAR